MGLKPLGARGMKNNYVHSRWVVQAGGTLSALLLQTCLCFSTGWSNVLVKMSSPQRERRGVRREHVFSHTETNAASRSGAPPAGSKLFTDTWANHNHESNNQKKKKFSLFVSPFLPTAWEAIIPLHISHWRLFGYPFCYQGMSLAAVFWQSFPQ